MTANFAQQRADEIKARRQEERSMTEHEHPIIHAQAVVPIAATASERLSQLHAAYDEAQAAFDAASSHLDAIKTGIKAELANLAPEGSTKIALSGNDGPPLTLTYAESWRVDSRKLKAEDPETYVRFAKMSGSWTLKAARGGASE